MQDYAHYVVKNLSVDTGEVRESNLLALEVELSAMSIDQLNNNLIALLSSSNAGTNKFVKSFTFLHMAAMLEAITINGAVSPQILSQLIKYTLESLANETNYQAYINNQHGWNHAIAHMGDLLAEVIKLPQTTFDQAQNITTAIISKVCEIECHLVGLEMDRLSRVITCAFIANKVTIDVYVKLIKDNKNNICNTDKNWQQSLTQSPQANLKYINFKDFITANYLQISLNKGLLPTDMSKTTSGLSQVLKQYDLGFYQSFS